MPAAPTWPVAEMRITKDKKFGLYGVCFTGGGELPSTLSGRFTSIVTAQKAIDDYIEARRLAYVSRKDKKFVKDLPTKKPRGRPAKGRAVT